MSTASRGDRSRRPGSNSSGKADPPSGRDSNDLARSDPPGPGQRPSAAGTPGQFAATGQGVHPAGFDERGRVKRGRISAAWVGLIAAALVLILLIIFIAQNLNRASIHFLGLSGRLPLGLLVLIAAVIGVLLVAVPGSVRIFQLRRALKANTPKRQRR